MKFVFLIAWRYIFSKKSTNAINVITGISMTGIVIGSAALIIVLSAFNGFEGLVKKLYGTFYPDVSIVLKEGKSFEIDGEVIASIRGLDGVEAVSGILEENALVVCGEKENIATLKGVDTEHTRVTSVIDSVFIGEYLLQRKVRGFDANGAVVGLGLASMLGINLGWDSDPVQVFMPRKSLKSSLNPQSAFRQKQIHVSGVFRIQQEFDSKYMIVQLAFLQDLLEADNHISALEIKTTSGYLSDDLKETISGIVGEDFIVEDRFQQNSFLYKVMKTEKWAVYLVLTFILIIAAFNMIGSVTMLVIEKKKDIGVLRSLGASSGTIQKIFLIEGLLQTIISTGIGFTIALILCLIQIKYGLIAIPGQGTFVVTAYPIKLQLFDFLLVFSTIMIIGILAAWFPARNASAEKWVFRGA